MSDIINLSKKKYDEQDLINFKGNFSVSRNNLFPADFFNSILDKNPNQTKNEKNGLSSEKLIFKEHPKILIPVFHRDNFSNINNKNTNKNNSVISKNNIYEKLNIISNRHNKNKNKNKNKKIESKIPITFPIKINNPLPLTPHINQTIKITSNNTIHKNNTIKQKNIKENELFRETSLMKNKSKKSHSQNMKSNNNKNKSKYNNINIKNKNVNSTKLIREYKTKTSTNKINKSTIVNKGNVSRNNNKMKKNSSVILVNNKRSIGYNLKTKVEKKLKRVISEVFEILPNNCEKDPSIKNRFDSLLKNIRCIKKILNDRAKSTKYYSNRSIHLSNFDYRINKK